MLKLKKYGLISLGVIIGLYVLVCIALIFMEDGMVYHPEYTTRETNYQALQALGLDYEQFTLPTDDGEKLDAIFAYPEGAAASEGEVILFCHGNAGNVSDMYYPERMVELTKRGFRVLVMDYRGYGKSTGKPSEEGLYNDARAAWHFLTQTKQIPAERIAIYGYSLGTGVAAQLATEVQARCLILEAPYTSVPDVGSFYYPFIPTNLLQKNRFETLNKMPRIAEPLQVFHSKEDVQIPYAMGEAVYNASPSARKQFVATRGGHIEAIVQDGLLMFDNMRTFIKTAQ